MRLYRGPSAVFGSGCRARLARATLRHGRCCILAAYLERKERALIDRVAVGRMFSLERRMALALCADVAASTSLPYSSSSRLVMMSPGPVPPNLIAVS